MDANELAPRRHEGGTVAEDDLVVDAVLRWRAIMSLHHSADTPTQSEIFDAFEALVRLRERFGHYDEPTKVLLSLAIDRFASAFGDDDWHAQIEDARPSTVTRLRAVAG